MTDNKHISLIQRSFSETLNAQEQSQLDAWMAASADNKAMYDEMAQMWSLVDQYPVDLDIDLDKEFAQVKSKIDQKPVVKKAPKLRRLYSILSAAACLLLIAAVWYNMTQETEVTYYAKSDNDKLSLPDGSTILLAAGSEVKYQKDWSDKRALKINGTGYFDIRSNAQKPLVIDGGNSTVTVLGTEFVYASDQDTGYVDLYEGKVKIDYAGKSLIVKADTTMVSHLLTRGNIQPRKSNVDQYKWCQPAFDFKDEELQKAMQTVANWYGLKVQLSDEIASCPITATFGAQSPAEIFEKIALLYSAKSVQKDTEWKFIGGSCQ